MADALPDGRTQVSCPNCDKAMRLDRLNDHLDLCLAGSAAADSTGAGRGTSVDLTSDAEEDPAIAGPRKRLRMSSGHCPYESQSHDVLGSMMVASRHASQTAQQTPPRPPIGSGPSQPPPANRARLPQDRHAFAAVPDTVGPNSAPKGRAHAQASTPGYGMGIGYATSAADAGKWLDASEPGASALFDAAPLAERMRPQTLWDFVGQEQAVRSLRALLRTSRGPPSLILWAPPGTGKTTLARIIAYHLKYPSTLEGASVNPGSPAKWRTLELSAITTGLQEIKKTLDDAGARLRRTGTRTMLMVDEFQRINRGLQDAFLAAVELGTICLVAATTENPSFRIVPALMSRMRVVLLQRLEVADVVAILRRAQRLTFGPEKPLCLSQPSANSCLSTSSDAEITVSSEQSPAAQSDAKAAQPSSSTKPRRGPKTGERPVPNGVVQYIASNADGDARTALNTLELSWALAGEVLGPRSEDGEEENTPIEEARATKEVVQALRAAKVRSGLAYDRSGDWHYDAISALHKSIRGGDASAAVYWLARMVQAGDDPLYVARRMIIAASEDCGSNPMALQMAMATYQAVQVVGLPEAGETLAQTAVYLAESPKDTRAYRAWQRATKMVHHTPSYPVPMHIRNAPTKLMKELGAGTDYRYEPRFLHPVVQSFLPPAVQGRERICSPPPVDDEMPYAESSSENERQEVDHMLTFPPLSRPQDRPLSAMEGAVVHRGTTKRRDAKLTRDVKRTSLKLPTSAPLPSTLLSAEAGMGEGACQRIMDVGSRVVDWDLLSEWERERNAGQPWQGRPGLLRAVRRRAQAQPELDG